MLDGVNISLHGPRIVLEMNPANGHEFYTKLFTIA